MKTSTVQNMRGNSGKEVPNQFEIFGNDENGLPTKTFQSYSSTIAVIRAGQAFSKHVTLDKEKWNYSKTTSKYRNIFLNETTKETERKIASGEYELADLN
jgi:hypothetical protein